MTKTVKGARIRQKRTLVENQIPTIPSNNDHTTGWLDTDIYEGELFLNVNNASPALWFRQNSGVTRVATLDENSKLPFDFLTNNTTGITHSFAVTTTITDTITGGTQYIILSGTSTNNATITNIIKLDNLETSVNVLYLSINLYVIGGTSYTVNIKDSNNTTITILSSTSTLSELIYLMWDGSKWITTSTSGTGDVKKSGTVDTNRIGIWNNTLNDLRGDASLTYVNSTGILSIGSGITFLTGDVRTITTYPDSNTHPIYIKGQAGGGTGTAAGYLILEGGIGGNASSGQGGAGGDIYLRGGNTGNGTVIGSSGGAVFIYGGDGNMGSSRGNIFLGTELGVGALPLSGASDTKLVYYNPNGGKLSYGSIPSGNVSSFGTPVNNQVAVWTNYTTIEGSSSFTWNGTVFGIRGDINFSSGGDRTIKILDFVSGDGNKLLLNAGGGINGGDFYLTAGKGINLLGGKIFIAGGSGQYANGGDVSISGGENFDSGNGGSVIINGGLGSNNYGSIYLGNSNTDSIYLNTTSIQIGTPVANQILFIDTVDNKLKRGTITPSSGGGVNWNGTLTNNGLVTTNSSNSSIISEDTLTWDGTNLDVSGNIQFSSGGPRDIKIIQAGGISSALNITGQNNNSSAPSGNINIIAGSNGNTSALPPANGGDGGNLQLKGGAGGDGTGANGVGGNINIIAGAGGTGAGSCGGTGGSISIKGGSGSANSSGGNVYICGGVGGSGLGNVYLGFSGTSASESIGSVYMSENTYFNNGSFKASKTRMAVPDNTSYVGNTEQTIISYTVSNANYILDIGTRLYRISFKGKATSSSAQIITIKLKKGTTILYNFSTSSYNNLEFDVKFEFGPFNSTSTSGGYTYMEMDGSGLGNGVIKVGTDLVTSGSGNNITVTLQSNQAGYNSMYVITKSIEVLDNYI